MDSFNFYALYKKIVFIHESVSSLFMLSDINKGDKNIEQGTVSKF
jgi:hypothetical protein